MKKKQKLIKRINSINGRKRQNYEITTRKTSCEVQGLRKYQTIYYHHKRKTINFDSLNVSPCILGEYLIIFYRKLYRKH